MALDPQRVEKALRELISRVDYDTHKYIECDEETGEDGYPDLVEDFIAYYESAEEDFSSDEEEHEGAI